MNSKSGSPRGEQRSSALWGTGNRGGDSRSNALWGKGGRGLVTALVAVLVVAAPLAAGARKDDQGQSGASSYIDPILMAKANSTPNAVVKVIIQGRGAEGGTKHALEAFHNVQDRSGSNPDEQIKDKYNFVNSIAVTLKAKRVLQLAHVPGLTVTFDAPMKLSGTVEPTSTHLWTTASGLKPLWGNLPAVGVKMPTIAIVDSGIEKNRADFDMGARVIDDVVITQLASNSPGDGRGHGTFVAGIAAGSAKDQAGAAPQANLISVDVMDDNGMARTSDVIAGAEWVYRNRIEKNIKVANFSLHSTMPSNFTNDPLDKAVEKLWFAGVTVVVAAGNYGKEDGPSGVPYAPGNDPFVITVGAIDLEGSVSIRKHDVPNWSAYGYTNDGFRKPELAAAGRYMVGPVPAAATLLKAKPDNVVAGGYMRLSGTSFAAPVVAGAAAQLVIQHPNWTPDQIKGALMQRARYIPEAPPGSAGVGEINASKASALTRPPNPNAALNTFVKANALLGSKEFDGAAWRAAAKSSASWDSVSWSDVSWSDVSWTDVSWSDVLAAADVSWEDNAEGEVGAPTGDYVLTPEEEAAAAELGLIDQLTLPPVSAPEPAPAPAPAPPAVTLP